MKELEQNNIKPFFTEISHPQLITQGIIAGITKKDVNLQLESGYEMYDRMPPWLNTQGLYDMISEINSKKVWALLLKNIPLETHHALRTFLNMKDTDETAEVISNNNARFMGRVLKQAIAGTAINKTQEPDFPDFLQNELTQMIADRYDDPPKDAQSLLTRIQGLVPNPDKNPRQNDTLFSILLKTKAFIAKDISTGEKITCPAIHLTKLMLDEWGRQLDTNEEYRQRFIATIQKPTAQ